MWKFPLVWWWWGRTLRVPLVLVFLLGLPILFCSLNPFAHEYLFLCFIAICGEKTKEYFSFPWPSYHLPKKKQFSSNTLVVFPAWHSAPCSDWCRKSFIRNRFASIWRKELLTDLRQWLLSVLPHTVWNCCMLSILRSGKFCSSYLSVKDSGILIVLYDPDSFFVLRVFQ